MLDLFLLVVPIFGIILLGCISAYSGIASKEMGEGLADFVYIFATPALLFKLIVGSTLPDILPLGYLYSYYIGVMCAWGLVMGISIFALKASWSDGVIAGLATGQANTVMIGIPLILKVYGEGGVIPISLLIAVNLPITMTIASLLLEGGKAKSKGSLVVDLLKKLVTHPILMAIFCAYGFKLAHLSIPTPIFTALEMLAATSIPVALFSLGMTLHRYGVLGQMRLVLVIMVGKLMLHPFLTFMLGTYVFKLSPVWLGSAVIFSAMPAGINAYLFAKRYGEGEALASSAVAITTFVSLFTTIGWLSLLPKP